MNIQLNIYNFKISISANFEKKEKLDLNIYYFKIP